MPTASKPAGREYRWYKADNRKLRTKLCALCKKTLWFLRETKKRKKNIENTCRQVGNIK